MNERVRDEWRARIAAEYTSAAITQHLTLWLIQVGAPPDLIDAGLAIVADELAHSRLSHEVYTAAGGTQPPNIDQGSLGLAGDGSLDDILRIAVRVFCLGETVAVPLFSHLRAPCTEPVAKAALDRILRDEVRHRDFGWDLLDWLSTVMPDASTRVTAALPEMMRELERSYGTGNEVVARDAAGMGSMTDAERAWGLAPPREYAQILARAIEHDFRPRFEARDVQLRKA